jgi:AcrR family transcriptional regulator
MTPGKPVSLIQKIGIRLFPVGKTARNGDLTGIALKRGAVQAAIIRCNLIRSRPNRSHMPRTMTPASESGRAPGNTTGKERILTSAMLLFTRMPYSDTSLRDIAAAAGVDVAYVHRSFGSKAEIFRQALLTLGPLDDIAAPQSDGPAMIRRLCNLAFVCCPQKLEDVRPLHLLVQSSLCSEAHNIITEFIDASLALPLSRAFGHLDSGRAHFAISLLSGFVTHRAILEPQGLLAIPEADQRRMLETALMNAMSDIDN